GVRVPTFPSPTFRLCAGTGSITLTLTNLLGQSVTQGMGSPDDSAIRCGVPNFPTHEGAKMFSRSRCQTVAVLAVGTGVGSLAASGKFDSLLNAESKPAATTQSAGPCPEEGCCATTDRTAALAAINAHNQKVSANLQKDGKKPNILVIWGDDIGQSN